MDPVFRPAVATYQISGTLTGLSAGESVVLQGNGGDNLTLTGNGAFTFTKQIAAGGTYNITVLTQPLHQMCTVTNGSGTLGDSNVTTITVTCAAGPQFAYVANAGDNTISAYSVNASTGALTPVTGSPFAAGAGPISVTVNPAGTFAYVANLNSNTVSAYSINASTGALTQVTGSPFTAGTYPYSITVAQP